MNWPLAARIARRELRGGIAGFRIFLICLALGVAAIAAVGMVRSAIEAGLSEQGAVILGGDAQAEFTYRYASDTEKAWMAGIATKTSEVVEFRSMAVAGEDQVLTQVKAVDAAYPLLGEVALQGGRINLRGQQLQRARAANHQLRLRQVRQCGAAQAGNAVVEHADDAAFFNQVCRFGIQGASAILRPSKSQTSTFKSNLSG